jgi:aryl-alcohol dehydrogenase-like predicted oxidoreductase
MKLALGTAQFGLRYGIANESGQVSVDDASAIMRLASQTGIDTIDTAMGYGESEERLGRIGVAGFNVVSKLPLIPEGVSDVDDWVVRQVAESMRRLRVGRLYGLLLHRPHQLLESQGDALYGALQRLKLSGQAQKIGVSVYEPSELDTLMARFDFDLVQSPFSVLDRRLDESGWLSRLHRRGTEVHARSVFLQGLLVMAPGRRPAAFARWAAVLRSYDRWVERTGLTPTMLCLQFALTRPEISRVVVGVDTLTQLEELVVASRARSVPVPTDVLCADGDLLNPAKWATQ